MSACSYTAQEDSMMGSIHDNLERYSMPSAGIYDLVTGLLFRGRYREIARAIAAETPPGSTVLDVSCGPGEVLVQLARIAPSLRTTGLDVDAGMIARAERKAARLSASPREGQPSRPHFLVADVGAMPFPDAAFDLVVSSYAAHHWPNRHAGLAEIMRVLRPGGRAIIWDIASPHEAADGPVHESEAAVGQVKGAAPHVTLISTVRMLLQFRRIPSQRFEFVKPGQPAPSGQAG